MLFTPKQRLKSVLHGKTVDRPPCICPGGMMNMIVEEVMDITGTHWPEAHGDPAAMAGLAVGIHEHGGIENFGVPFCMTLEAEAMGAPVFMGTRTNEPRVTGYPLSSVTEWEKLGSIDVKKGRARVVLDAIEILAKERFEVPIAANLTGPVSLAASLIEPVLFFKALRRNPRKVHDMMGYLTENLIRFGRAQLDAGADLLVISDPSGTGEILGPKMFREFAVPYLNRITDALEPDAETGTIVHICGRLKGVFAELNDLNCHGLSFDSITSVKQVKENVFGKAIMGNVSTFALENNTPEKIGSISVNCMKSGVDILSPACGIGPRTPLKNIKAMARAAKTYQG